MYVDGVQDGAGVAYAGDFNNAGTAWIIGAYGATLGSSFAIGPANIDEVAIYTSALSAARVLAHYNKGHFG